VEQHHRTGFDLAHQHVTGGFKVGVVDPIERDYIPKDSGLAVPGGNGVDRVVGDPAGRPPQLGFLTGRGGDGVVGPAELCGDIGGRDGGQVRVFPGVAADLHARLGHPFGTGRIGGHLVADHEKGGLGVGVVEYTQ
jgi:hypothetical protein